MNNHIELRWMISLDRPHVQVIENESFSNPWSNDDFERWLKDRDCIGIVAEFQDQIVGFMIYELHERRICVLNLAVAPEFRRMGVGTAVVKKLLGKLSYERKNRLMIEVRESNLGAQLFLKALEFKAIQILKGFYPDSDEDAYLMSYRYKPSFGEATIAEQAAEHFSRGRA